MRALILAVLLAACSPAAAPNAETEEAPTAAETASDTAAALAQMPPLDGARAAGVDFRGVGQEPGWIVDIYQRERIRLLWDYGEQLADFPLPTPAYPAEGATRYDTQASGKTLSVSIRRVPCEDAMSGEPYPATVEVTIDGRTLHGCGRSV